MIKISVHAPLNLFSFSWPVLFSKPLDWITSIFAVIAAIFTVTKRDDVSGRIATTFRYWYPMILRQCIRAKQILRVIGMTTTYGTSVIPINETEFPLGISKIAFLRAPFLFTPAFNCTHLFPVSILPSLVVNSMFPFMFNVIKSMAFLSTIRIFLLKLHSPDMSLFRIIQLFTSGIIAIQAKTVSAVRSFLVFLEFSVRFPVTTLATDTTNGSRFVEHDVFPSPYSMMLSASAGIGRLSGCNPYADKLDYTTNLCFIANKERI